jgi:hypothetical protein
MEQRVVEIKSTIEDSYLTLEVPNESGWTFHARLKGPHVSGAVDVSDLSKAELPGFFRSWLTDPGTAGKARSPIGRSRGN